MAISQASRSGLDDLAKPKSLNRARQSADFSNAATGTYTDAGQTWKYVQFTGNGTLTVTKPGFADVLLQAAGGGGSSETGGEAGTTMLLTDLYLAAGSITVTVGAGGGTNPTGGSPPFNGGSAGANTVLGSIVARGGTGGGFQRSPGNPANPGSVTTSITGSSATYPNATYGNGGSTAPAAGAGGYLVVRVRV